MSRSSCVQFGFGAGTAWLLIVSAALAQDPNAPLVEREPFDRITLTSAAGGNSIDVLPLDLPGRVMPEPRPAGLLKVRVLENTSTLYEVNWDDIAQIEFYEQLLLAEANENMRTGKLAAAFDAIVLLTRNYASLPGVSELELKFMQQSAVTAFREGQTERALAILAGLYERNPRFPGLAKGVDSVSQKRMEALVGARDLRGAREFLDRTEKQFAGVTLTFADTWRKRFEVAARERITQGERLLAAKEFQAARRSVGQARDIWPRSREATQLLEQINRAYPVVLVGVSELADPTTPVRLDTPNARRLDAATQSPVIRLRGYGGEGGQYISPWGEVQVDSALRGLSLTLSSTAASADAPYLLVRKILSLVADPAAPEFNPALAEVLETVQVAPPNRVELAFRRAHSRPAALLLGYQWELGANPALLKLDKLSAESAGLRSTTAQLGRLSIEELRFPTDQTLVNGLVRGDIDLVASLPPWRLRDVQAAGDLRTGAYRLPRVHVLIPNFSVPLIQQREFRRALCYAIDRQRILSEVLLAGAEAPGFVLLSGPFPAGRNLGDTLRYAYNDQVAPRPYDPRLGAILATTAWTAVLKAEQGENFRPAELPTVRLAHGADPIARVACQSMQVQLELIGIKLQLQELSERELAAENGPWDLRYATLTIQEPLIDARRLIGPGGLAGPCSDMLASALRQIDASQNSRDVSAALGLVHKIAATDLPMIPLWQTIDYYAYRDSLRGITDDAVELYDSADRWRRDLLGGAP